MSKIAKSKSLFHIVPKNSELVAQINKFKLNGIDYKTLYPGEQLSDDVSTCIIQYINNSNIKKKTFSIQKRIYKNILLAFIRKKTQRNCYHFLFLNFIGCKLLFEID